MILPPFYLTWWFKMLAIIGLAALIYALCRVRIKAVSSRLKKEISLHDLLFKHEISKREKEVIDLILASKRNKVIEDELYISYHTVESSPAEIYTHSGKKFHRPSVDARRSFPGMQRKELN